MKLFCLSIIIVFISLISKLSQAQILFEGYSKITLGGQFIGFVIQRYEYNNTSKNFISTSLIKYNEAGGLMTESLRASANEALEPLNYTYNLLSAQGGKTIDATHQNGKLKLVITEKGKKQIKEKVLPKGAFFSSFLAYVILKNPKGLKASTKYDYQAVAEEDGEVSTGTAIVESSETYKGVPVFKIINDYKDEKFISYATEKGEMLATMAPQKLLNLELMVEPSQAMGSLSVSSDNLRLLFGNIPEGKVNALNNTKDGSIKLASSKPVGVVPKLTGTPQASPTSAPQISPTEIPQTSSPVEISKPGAVKSLELQTPPKSTSPGKQGARKGLNIQTKQK